MHLIKLFVCLLFFVTAGQARKAPPRKDVETESSSEYTVQMGSNSELKIEYGLSSGTPKNHGETSVQPLKRKNSVLSVSISDPAKVNSLSEATLTVDSLENDEVVENEFQRKRRQATGVREIRLKLTKIGPNTYVTDSFVAPTDLFRVKLFNHYVIMKPFNMSRNKRFHDAF